MKPIEITRDNFTEEVANSPVPVLIDLWAPWCGPCRMQGPIFESVAEDLSAGPAKFFKVNVDEAPELAGRFGVQSIPTILVLKDGVEADVRVGLTAAPALKAMVAAAG